MKIAQDYRDITNQPNLLFFIHGFTSSNFIFDKYRKDFPDCDIIQLVLPGHGCDTEKEFISSTNQQWLDYAVCEFSKVKDNYKNITVIGHSMGGLIGTWLAYKYKVDQLVILSPAFEAKDKLANFAWILKYFVKKTPQTDRVRYALRAEADVPSNEKVAQEEIYRKYVYLSAVHELQKLMSKVQKAVKKHTSISCNPKRVLVLWTKDDEAIDQKEVWKFIENLNQDFLCDATSVILDEGEHEFMFGENRFKAYDTINSYIKVGIRSNDLSDVLRGNNLLGGSI